MSPKNPFDTEDFRKLKALWEKKLRKSKFEDIESHTDKVKGEYSLKTYHSFKFRAKNPDRMSALSDYFRICGHFLNDHKFKNAIEKHIWEMHTEGKTRKEIAKAMKKYSVTAIHTTIAELEKQMINKAKGKA